MGSIFKAPKPPPAPKPVPLPPPPEPPPAPEPVPEMPVPDDKAARSGAEKKAALASQRSGRASTIFTEDDDGKLG